MRVPRGFVTTPWVPPWLLGLCALGCLAAADAVHGGMPPRVATGTYLGDGTAIRGITGLGFAPDLVFVKSENAEPASLRTRTMPEGFAKRLGIRAVLEPDQIRSFDADGFTVGSGAAVNDAGAAYHWIAIEEVAGYFSLGTYLGDGTNNRPITGVGFAPVYMIVLGEASEEALQRFSAQAPEKCLPFSSADEKSNRLQNFLPDGFEIGSDPETNALGVAFHWMAWALDPSSFVTGSYVGNNADGRSIAATTFLPRGVLIKSSKKDTGTVLRSSTLVGDLCLSVHNANAFANGVQALLATGFELGSDRSVNDSGKTYYWIAFRGGGGADVGIALAANIDSPSVGETVRLRATATNFGPLPASVITVDLPVPSLLQYAGDAASQGAYDLPSGLWSLGGLAAGASATLDVDVVVPVEARGRTVPILAQAHGSSPPDPNGANDSASLALEIAGNMLGFSALQSSRVLVPGAPPVEVLRLRIANGSAEAETLTALTLSNQTLGPGMPSDLDADWQRLELDRVLSTRTGRDPETVPASVAGGQATFSGRDFEVSSGDTLVLAVFGSASLAARDSDRLDLRVAESADLAFTRRVTLDASFPVNPSGLFPVDGMSARQIAVGENLEVDLLTGSVRNLALAALLPANGYEPDTLRFLNLRNAGGALPGHDLERVEAWIDEGDGLFEPLEDELLGELSFTGNRWQMTGLAVPVPVGGVLLFVSCDVSSGATESRIVQFAIPVSPVAGIGMQSANDGPVDQELLSPVSQTISTINRVTFATRQLAPGSVSPGDPDAVLLHLVASNNYVDSTKTLAQLSLENVSSGAGTPQELDENIELLELRAGSPSGPVLASGSFSGSSATFSGLAFDILPGETQELFITGDVALGAADGDVLGVSIGSEIDFGFEETVRIAASYPLDSEARWTIDGLVAEQIEDVGSPVATLGPNEGPILALEFHLPRNGYLDDVLEGLRLSNAGSAGPSNVAAMRLWRDDGDALFDAGLGDDVDLGPMVALGPAWVSQALAEPLGEAGLRLFASVVASGSPTDSATLVLGVPIGGVTVRSENDGPLDAALTTSNAVVFTTSSLRSEIEMEENVSTLGDVVTVTLSARNVGANAIDGVAPSVLESIGEGVLTVLSGPSPASLDLPGSSEAAFTWTLRADAAGTVRLSASVSGVESGSGILRSSLETSSSPHRIFLQAQELNLFPTESMPFSINRGQHQVVPLSLTLSNQGGDQSSDILLRRVVLRLLDQSGGGIVPSELLSRVVVNEGTNVFLDRTTLETSGSTLDLVLSRPVLIESEGTSGGQATISLSLDVSATTLVPSFRLSIDTETSLTAEDATNGAPVSIALDPGESFPIQSGLARVVAEATELEVAAVSEPPRNVGRGQSDVTLLTLTLENPGPLGLGSDLRVSAFELTLLDSKGAAISEPREILSRIEVRSASQTLLNRAVGELDDATIALALSPLLSVPAATPIELAIAGEISSDGRLGAFQARLGDSALFQARDANTLAPLPVVYASDPVEGSAVTVQAAAPPLLASALPSLPPNLSLGDTDVSVMTLRLVHPGPGESGPIRADSVVVQLRDAANAPLVPATCVDRARALRGGVEIGLTTNLPSSGGSFGLGLDGVTLSPSDTAAIEIRFDVEVGAPATLLEMRIAEGGIHAFDGNSGSRVDAVASGSEFPLSSGFTRLQAPARELAVGFAAMMPAALVADGSELPVAFLTLLNAASEGSGAIDVASLELLASDKAFAALPAGKAITRSRAYVAGELWAESSELAPDADTAVLTAGEPLSLVPGQPVEVELRITTREGEGVSSLRLGCEAEGIGVVQPSSSLLTVAVLAQDGQTFPFWTEPASFSPQTLEKSWANFPNPFGAGRETTTFAYFLPKPGKVTLTLWSSRGRRVRALLEGVPHAAGLHQSTGWDGRNGNGDVVLNGVYIAEIVAAYDDGSSERHLRKLAVVR